MPQNVFYPLIQETSTVNGVVIFILQNQIGRLLAVAQEKMQFATMQASVREPLWSDNGRMTENEHVLVLSFSQHIDGLHLSWNIVSRSGNMKFLWQNQDSNVRDYRNIRELDMIQTAVVAILARIGCC